MVDPTNLILWELVERHLDEAAFLFRQRRWLLKAPHYTLADLAEREEGRLLAHVDGLLVAGRPVADRLLGPALEKNEIDQPFVAAYTLLELGGLAALERLLERYPALPASAQVGVAWAWLLTEVPGVTLALLDWLPRVEGDTRVHILWALVGRFVEPVTLPAVVLYDQDVTTRRAVLRASWIATPDQLSVHSGWRRLLAHDDGNLDEALVAGLLHRSRGALDDCRKLAMAGTVNGWAELLLAMFGAPDDIHRLVERASRSTWEAGSKSAENILWALGFCGRRAAAEACLPWLSDPSLLGSLAAEAFIGITGAPTMAHRARSAPLTMLSGISSSAARGYDRSRSAGTQLVEGHLPRLDEAATIVWWAKARAGFQEDTRYLWGFPMSFESVVSQLIHGPLRRREMLALELLVRSRGQVRVDCGALVERQRRELQALLRHPLDIDFQKSLDAQ